MQETQVLSLGWKDPLEKEIAIHPSILAWRIPWTVGPGWPQLRSLLPFGPRSQASLQKAQGPGEPSSLLPPHSIPLGRPSVPAPSMSDF